MIYLRPELDRVVDAWWNGHHGSRLSDLSALKRMVAGWTEEADMLRESAEASRKEVERLRNLLTNALDAAMLPNGDERGRYIKFIRARAPAASPQPATKQECAHPFDLQSADGQCRAVALLRRAIDYDAWSPDDELEAAAFLSEFDKKGTPT